MTKKHASLTPNIVKRKLTVISDSFTERTSCSPEDSCWTQIEQFYDKMEQIDKNMISEEALKYLVKSYSGQALYEGVDLAIRQGRFDDIQGYLTALFNNLKVNGKKFEYKNYGTPLWRGIRGNLSDKYKVNDIMLFSSFSSSSKDYFVAKRFSCGGTIIRIFTCGENNPATKIEFQEGKDWSFFESEKEVLLMPAFQFQVIDVQEFTKYQRE